MERKYGALRFVAVLMKIIGAISIIAGLLGVASAIYFLARGQAYPGIGVNLIWSFVPIVSGIFWWAIAELIYVFIDIEYNTRRMAMSGAVVRDIAAD
ncbi:MAG: hypothetical protein ACXVZV_09705 [Terriglobales bacterium]